MCMIDSPLNEASGVVLEPVFRESYSRHTVESLTLHPQDQCMGRVESVALGRPSLVQEPGTLPSAPRLD